MAAESRIPDGPRRRLNTAGAGVLASVLLAVAGAALGAMALFVVFGLPAYVAPREPAAVAPQPQAAPAVPAPTVARPAVDPDRPEAERLLTEALRQLAQLEGEGARIWGGEVVAGTNLPLAEEFLARANALFDRQAYSDAATAFREAIARLDALAGSRPERLRLAMAAGQAAFAADDAAGAVRHLEIAAALQPGDEAVRTLLERARNLPGVLAQLAAGAKAESAGDLGAAREAYRAAAALDPASARARDAVSRIEAMIAARDYRAAVSEVLARLREANVTAAAAALERARRADPKGAELADLGARVQAARRAAALEGLRRQAADLERQERWPEAVAIYDQALKLDRDAAFAQTRRAQAQQLAQLHAALDAYLAEPARLQSAEPLAHARSLLVQANGVAADGPVLASKRQQLEQLVVAAQTPLPVILKSDRDTEVTVYRIGALGRFDTRRIELPPGRYVAVGSRDGYRDVRVTFDVPAGGSQQAVLVQCSEPIR